MIIVTVDEAMILPCFYHTSCSVLYTLCFPSCHTHKDTYLARLYRLKLAANFSQKITKAILLSPDYVC